MSITYSHENAGKLPGKRTKFDRNAPDLKSAFDEARNGVARGSGAPQSERGSDMVKQDRPIPTLRPGPGLAAAADSQAHSDRLDRGPPRLHTSEVTLDRLPSAGRVGCLDLTGRRVVHAAQSRAEKEMV